MSSEDPPVIEDLPILPAIGRLLGPGFISWLYAQGRRRFRAINAQVEVQRRAYDLPPAYGDAVMDGAYRADETFALYSPIMGGERRVPPVPTTIGGFALFDRDDQPGEALAPQAQAFLAVGDPPIAFTLGSFGVLAARGFYEEAVLASRVLGRRAVLLVGRDNEARLRASLGGEDVLVLGYAPHSQIFPRCAAIVHHGGIGTTGQALRSGAPQLVCAMFGDQPDNAYRIKRLGVGDSLPFRKFGGRRAAKALRPLLDDPDIRARARQAAVTVGQENGARALAERIVRRIGV
jgi:UDP:flavonoid glycosyltransferase YjiC (YdhE family)